MRCQGIGNCFLLIHVRHLSELAINTDMPLKNFTRFHTDSSLRLTPTYDQVAASLYNYKPFALTIAQSKDRPIGDLKGRPLALLGEESGLSVATD